MTIFKNVFQHHLEQRDTEEDRINEWEEALAEQAEQTDLRAPIASIAPFEPAPSELQEDHPSVFRLEDEASLEEKSEPFSPPTELDPELAARAAEAHRLIEETQTMRHSPDGAPSEGTRPDMAGTSAPAQRPARTRLLGFGAAATDLADPLGDLSASPAQAKFPCGWLVIVDGPGKGESFALHAGVAQIGRGSDQAISLDFGDRAISREQHAAVAYDPEVGKFYLGHGGKANIIRLNDRPVLSTEEMAHGDMIRIGETILRFAAFCDQSFGWGEGGS